MQVDPSGIALLEAGMTDETTLAAIICVTRGNFRLLYRLFTQIGQMAAWDVVRGAV
jgi:hypothetical protein